MDSGSGSAVRPAAVAGTFYPDDPAELRRTVEALLAEVPPTDDEAPKALVVPHAGYVYSGPVAATGYARVASRRGLIERVVLLGPAHRVPLRGLGISGADAFETPLGAVRVDDEARRRLLALADVHIDDRAHAGEHSLEVHLPFLQVVLGDVPVVPLVVGAADPGTVAAVLDEVWGGDETLIVVSTDLSHYLDHATAARADAATAAAVVACRAGDIGPEAACGAYPLRGLLLAAERHGLAVDLLDLRSSGDTAGPRDRVVGYGAFALA